MQPMKSLLRSVSSTVLRLQPSRPIATSASCRDIFSIEDEDDFKKRVLQSETPVLVDFYADWCGPCKALTPRLTKVVSRAGASLHLAKVNIDEVSDLALEYEVSAVPAVVAVQGGAVVKRFVGLQDERAIQAFVEAAFGEL